LASTLPVGQYDFPKGLFFGGHKPSKTYQILAANFPRWIEAATDVLQIDFHTGLGQKATYKLFTEEPVNERTQWLIGEFGADVVEAYQPRGAAYISRGSLGSWCQAMFPKVNYNFLTAEFGTYPIIKVVEALRAENRAHFFSPPLHPSREWTFQQLVEVFAPADPRWRDAVVSAGLDLIQRAIQVGFQSA
jgi:hypothetical protein